MSHLEARLAQARAELISMGEIDGGEPRDQLLRTSLMALQASLATRPGPDSPEMDMEAHAFLYLKRFLDGEPRR